MTTLSCVEPTTWQVSGAPQEATPMRLSLPRARAPTPPARSQCEASRNALADGVADAISLFSSSSNQGPIDGKYHRFDDCISSEIDRRPCSCQHVSGRRHVGGGEREPAPVPQATLQSQRYDLGITVAEPPPVCSHTCEEPAPPLRVGR